MGTAQIATGIASKAAGVGSGRKQRKRKQAKKALKQGSSKVDSVFKKSIS